MSPKHVLLVFSVLLHVVYVVAYCQTNSDCRSVQCKIPKCKSNQEFFKHRCQCCPGCITVISKGEKCMHHKYYASTPCATGSKCKWIPRGQGINEGLPFGSWGWYCILEKFVGGMK